MPRRIDAEDTVDAAVHLLHRLQAEGWGMSSLHCDIEYGTPADGARNLPTRAVVQITLRPVHD